MTVSMSKMILRSCAVMGACVFVTVFVSPRTDAKTLAEKAANVAKPSPAKLFSTEIDGGDLLFLSQAAPQNALVIELSKMAVRRAVTPEVKQLAAMVEKSQSQTATELKDLGAKKQVTVASIPDGAGRKLTQECAKLKGAKFDKKYLDLLSENEQVLVTTFGQGARSTDHDIQAFATANLALLKQQANEVKRLSGT